MAFDITKRVGKAFESTGPRNPLNRLQEVDKCLLWAWLTVYSSCEVEPKKRFDFLSWLERTTQTAADADALATRIQAQVFQSEFAKSVSPFVIGFQDVPLRLHAFASRLGEVLGSFGKPGHKGRVLNNRFLIMASEFVRLRTGKHHDEHLAELYQAIRMEPENSSATPGDFSGDAIRKKREHFKKTYPLLYRHAMNEVFGHVSKGILDPAFFSEMRAAALSSFSGYPKPGSSKRLERRALVKPPEETASGGPRSRTGEAGELETSHARGGPRSGRRSVRTRTRVVS